MGTYLSTPVTEKQTESDAALDCPVAPLAFGVVDMQGWRKSMEDAHVGVVDRVELPRHLLLQNPNNKNSNNDDKEEIPSAKIFGVFDGHGGPEVARFCQLYLVSVLTQQPTPTWLEPQPLDNHNDNDNNDNPSTMDIGVALRMTFHALDRMIDAPEYRNELIRLRSLKPNLGERRAAHDIPLPRPLPPQQSQQNHDNNNNNNNNNSTTASLPPPSVELVLDPHSSSFATEKKDDDSDAVAGKEEATQLDQDLMNEDDDDDDDHQGYHEDGKSNGNNDENMADENCSDDENDTPAPTTASSSSSSSSMAQEQQQQQQQQQQQDDTSGDDADTEDEASGTAGKMSVMLQRLLQMSSASTPPTSPAAAAQTIVHNDSRTPPPTAETALQVLEQHGPPTVDSTLAPASVFQNGRSICNLPDHVIHAGATAVVAVLHGTTLTVANAGDSRGVLCRDGVAFPLSFDHKPSSPVESKRIRNAGGFVNHFGRVNGNLNLSRSLGDLKYKQVARCTAAQQMITAEPDILQVELDLTQDEFFILACDGIWDCMTNQEAVTYVKQRLDKNDEDGDDASSPKSLTDIGAQLLDDILSTDPRVTQGIGGDNMTVMIVDLQPHKRKSVVKNDPPTTAMETTEDNAEEMQGETNALADASFNQDDDDAAAEKQMELETPAAAL